MYASPIFRPEMMFSYLTPSLQLFGDSEMGFLGSIQQKLTFLKLGTWLLVLIWLRDCEKKDFNEYLKKNVNNDGLKGVAGRSNGVLWRHLWSGRKKCVVCRPSLVTSFIIIVITFTTAIIIKGPDSVISSNPPCKRGEWLTGYH